MACPSSSPGWQLRGASPQAAEQQQQFASSAAYARQQAAAAAAAAAGFHAAKAAHAAAAAAPGEASPSDSDTDSAGPVRVPLKLVVADAVQRWFNECLSEARRGDVKQQALLSQMYAEGYGCKADAEQAKAWADRARLRGYTMSGVYDAF
ncbi:hypothetical protein HT031_001453 [Scenedesmus sp. PABB004]|nr:hypothetical protein HT031_001453 [Scenedesmus sp. PABB004]